MSYSPRTFFPRNTLPLQKKISVLVCYCTHQTSQLSMLPSTGQYSCCGTNGRQKMEAFVCALLMAKLSHICMMKHILMSLCEHITKDTVDKKAVLKLQLVSSHMVVTLSFDLSCKTFCSLNDKCFQ